MRVRHLALTMAAGVAVLAIVAGLGACTSSGSSSGLPDQVPPASASPSSTASGFGATGSKAYGFTLKYPLGWVAASKSAGVADKSGGPLVSLIWADPSGKQVDDHYVDSLQLSVYAMSKRLGPTDLTRHAADFKGIAYSLIRNLPQLSVTDPLKPIDLNGTKGFQITYRFSINGTLAGAMSYLLPRGRYAYWVTGQASRSTWSAAWSKMAPAMASLTIRDVTTN